MMANKSLRIIRIHIWFSYFALIAFELYFLFVAKYNEIAPKTGPFKMTTDHGSRHGRPFVTQCVAPRQYDPANEKSDIEIEDETSHMNGARITWPVALDNGLRALTGLRESKNKGNRRSFDYDGRKVRAHLRSGSQSLLLIEVEGSVFLQDF